MAEAVNLETVYIVDSNRNESSRIANALADEPYTVRNYDNAALFLDEIAATASGCVLAPLDLPGVGLRGLIDEINGRQLPLAVVVIGRDSEFTIAVELMRSGIFDFLEHPFSDRRLRSAVRCAIGLGI